MGFIPAKCYYCGTVGQLLEVKAYVKDSSGSLISNNVPAYECQECGKVTYTQESYSATERAYKLNNKKSN
ncbi:YgiT-type zinc finger protein [Paenibacillus sp. N3/727]|uniref:YgiT-type zinc finger protein n=1 Tax=Paenibacillus sp. N3/727 TaxID=2925845 RepID=UPI001F53130B|nr:YgiT-type zinc finger protein [Paenibacillus sp. N3/727]UNK19280.1 YgiT-type zinc finger protein [Paenibacillus sp. N3/727]